MGNDARPSRKDKDDETSNLKGKQSSDKGLSTSSSATSDTFGLRRSSREALVKKNAVPASPTVRKSERIEKRVSMTPTNKGKLDKVGKKSTPSPLRRSDRGKSSFSPSSASKRSDKSSSSLSLKRKKGKKEKSVKQLTLETEEVGKSETQALKHDRVKKKRKRLNAASYMGWFKTPKSKKVKAVDETIEDHDGGNEPSGSSTKPACGKEAHEFEDGDLLAASSTGESAMLLSNDAVTEKIDDEPDAREVNCSTMEKANEPNLMDSPFNETTMEDQRGIVDDQEIMDVDSVALGTSASKEVCASIADTASVLPSDCIRSSPVEKFDANLKRQRVNLDSKGGSFSSNNANLNQELAVTSLTMDRGEHDASTTMGLAEKCDNHMRQKESPRDLEKSGQQNTCFTCKLGGKLLCCHGRECKRSYHPTCLDPPMDDAPTGVWYCLMCVWKKLDSGVHSVSEGIELICYVREVEVLDVDELRQEREFRVKYKGLAHIHNRWVSESKLLLEAASLVEKFNRENQVARWNPEWVVPDCLLRKRLLMSPEQHDQNLTNQDREKLNGHYEWLVKWRGLDCKHATWELDNSVFFSSAYGESLIKEYENRQSGASSSKVDKILEGENCSSVKLSQLQSGMSSRLDSDLSDHITKLREFWLKGQNAVVIDEQERILMVISLIQSFQPKTCRPFLIISTSAALHLWDDEFIRLVNFVVYNGNKDLRSIIRKLEFNEGGCPMFQVLITTLDIVLEALDVLRSVEWELIIIDELQCTRISSHCAQIKLLATKRRLLLVSGQLKGSTAEYLNLLSLLESPSDLQNGVSLLNSSSDNIGKLKEKFSRYIAYRSKSESSFKEYWVPVQMSNVQLEQYCGSLMSNSVLLCSSSKHDIVGAFHEVLMSCQKCCNHPFTVDRSIQRSLTEGLKGVEFLNAAIKASGKLQLLEMMLLEIQKRGLRVLILFQDFGKDNIGYVLEDLLIQKFGENSYERVDHGLTPAKKNTALNNFNRERGRFVFLIETRACLSSIKLSSVDTVIIYASDWNPLIDVRALQKITLDSKPEQVTVFRLYSPYTLEEKVLILAKQGKFLDSKLENISLAISHMLLMWGASHQFKTLDEFHAEGLTASPAKSLSKEPSLEDIIQDFLQILSSNGKDSGSSTILNVPQVGGVYHSESPLFGELRSEVMDKVQPHLFWTQLLGGKHPQWKYISGSSQRNRKRVHYSEESAKNTETESDEAVKKRKKLINSKVAPPTIELGSAAKPISGYRVGACGTTADNLRNCLPRSTARINEMICANSASSSRLGNNFLEIPQDHNIESEERREMRDAQKILHLSLKPEILELCKILKLSDRARGVVGEFLEYVMNNHHVNRESKTILQAFQISLCWTVASLLKQKIDHKESLALAKQHLKFNCKKEEADFVYSMLRCLKTTFLYWTGKLKVVDFPKVPTLSTTCTPKDSMQVNSPQPMSSNKQKVKVGVEDCSVNPECSDKDSLSLSERAAVFKLAEKDVAKSIKQIQKKCQKQLEKLIQKQEEEKSAIERSYSEENVQIQKKQNLKIAAISLCFEHNTSMRVDKLKLVDSSFAKEFEELKNQRDMRLKNLEAKHTDAKRIIQERESQWVQVVESWACDELLGKPPLSEAVPGLKCSQNSKPVRVEDNPGNSPVSGNLLNNKLLHRTPETVSSEAVTFGRMEMAPSLHICENARLDTMASDKFSGSEFPEQRHVSDAQVIVSNDPSAKVYIPDRATPSMLDGKVIPEAPESGSPVDVTGKIFSNKGSLCEERVPDESALVVPEIVSSTNGLVNVDSVVQMSAEKQIRDRVTLNMLDGEIPFSVPEVTHHEVEVDRTSKENCGMCNLTSNSVTHNSQQDRADNAVNQNSLLQELSLVNLSSVQPTITLTHGAPVPPNQVHVDECNQPSITCGIQIEDAPPADNQNALEEIEQSASQPVEIEQSNQPLHAFEPTVQVHLSPSNLASNDNPADVPLVEESEHQPSNDGCNSIQVSQAPVEFVENPQFSNQAVSQPVTCSLNPSIGTSGTEFSNRPTHATPAVASWVAPPLCPDPLQKELERLCQEFDQTRKSHDDKKLHLKSDCEKEIAQIHQKYEMKYKEIDAEYSTKEKEFEEIRNKLWLNKILAEAFRSKCMEVRQWGRSGMQQPQDMNATLMQQLVQLQQSMQVQQSAQRPPLVVGTSSASSPATTLLASGRELNPQPSLPAPVIGQNTTPPVPNVNPSSSLFPSTTTRPPQISSVSYSTGNPQSSGQIRARPPHLRASTTSLPSHPRGIQTQPTNSPALTSNALPCLPPRLPSSMYQSGPCERVLRPETAPSNLSLSSLELLRSFDHRPAASQPVSLPAVPGLFLNTEKSNTSEFGQSGMQVNLGGPSDVVYLSDDD